VFRVKVTLDNARGIFKPGMPADAYFSSTPAPSSQPTADSRQNTCPADRGASAAPPHVLALAAAEA
jgi:hypothetical protein